MSAKKYFKQPARRRGPAFPNGGVNIQKSPKGKSPKKLFTGKPGLTKRARRKPAVLKKLTAKR